MGLGTHIAGLTVMSLLFPVSANVIVDIFEISLDISAPVDSFVKFSNKSNMPQVWDDGQGELSPEESELMDQLIKKLWTSNVKDESIIEYCLDLWKRHKVTSDFPSN